MNIVLPSAASTDRPPSTFGNLQANDAAAENGDTKVVNFPMVPGVAAQYTQLQVLNAAGSGRVLLIDWFLLLPSSTPGYELRSHNVALATDNGVLVGQSPGSGDGIEHSFYETNAVLLGTQLFASQYTVTGSNQIFTLPYPIILVAGEGLIIAASAVQKSLRALVGVREL